MQRVGRRRFGEKASQQEIVIPEGGYVIIGDTITALLYCYNLFLHFASQKPPLYPKIYLLCEGPDLNETWVNRASQADYIVTNARDMAAHLTPTTIHLIPYDGNYYSSSSSSSENKRDLRIIIEDGPVEEDVEESFTYYSGRGVAGDIIGSYYNPRFGPYMRGYEGVNILNFVANNGVMSSTSSDERRITKLLIDKFKLTAAKVDAASMARTNRVEYSFMSQRADGELRRKVFKAKYDILASPEAPNVTIYNSCDIRFSNPDGRLETSRNELVREELNDVKYWDVEARRDLAIIRKAKVIFKANPYDHVRIAGRGGIRNFGLDVPVTYRAVLRYELGTGTATSQNSSRVAATDPDGVVSHVSFTLDKNKLGNDTDPIMWAVSAYTTYEDYADVTLRTNSGSTRHILLVVEAINLLFSRKVEYDYENLGIVDVHLQEPELEERYRLAFAEITATIYEAFSGQTISTDALLGLQQICLEKGPCMDEYLITSFPRRETPLDVIFNAANNSSGGGRTGGYRN